MAKLSITLKIAGTSYPFPDIESSREEIYRHAEREVNRLFADSAHPSLLPKDQLALAALHLAMENAEMRASRSLGPEADRLAAIDEAIRGCLAENEKNYGGEIRKKYGDAAIDAANAKITELTKREYDDLQELTEQIKTLLKEAYHEGDPAGELAQQVCELHKKWLGYYWPNYSKEAHLGLAQTYTTDPRFKKYYDDIEAGCAEFLYEALKIYCE